MKSSLSYLLGLAALVATSSAYAGPIPYPSSGTENPLLYTFMAGSTGDLSAYFLGTGASYNETLGVLVNGVDSGITGLPNHGSAAGERLDFGSVNAGDTLTFFINVQTTGNTYYSNMGLNLDGATTFTRRVTLAAPLDPTLSQPERMLVLKI